MVKMGFTSTQQCQDERQTHILPSESMRLLIYAVDYVLDYSLTLDKVITVYASISSHLLLAKSNYRAGLRRSSIYKEEFAGHLCYLFSITTRERDLSVSYGKQAGSENVGLYIQNKHDEEA